jgi:hypothetical protein
LRFELQFTDAHLAPRALADSVQMKLYAANVALR